MAIAIVVFGPLVAVFVLLFKSIRKLMPQAPAIQDWERRTEDPPSGGDLAGDREPRRPLSPIGSGAISLALPT